MYIKQYIGQTVEIFRIRWNNYKDSTGKRDRRNVVLYEKAFV